MDLPTPPVQQSPQPTQPASLETPQPKTESFPTPAHPTPRFLSKKIAIIALVLILIIFSAVGVLAVMTQQKPPQASNSITPTTLPSPLPTTNPTADWKTYSDPQNRFTLKYPEIWFNGVSSDGTILFDNKKVVGSEVMEPNQVPITLEIVTDQELIKLYSNNTSANAVKKDISGILFDYIEFTNQEGMPAQYTVSAQTIQNGTFYALKLTNNSYKEIFDKILFTFKFTQ